MSIEILPFSNQAPEPEEPSITTHIRKPTHFSGQEVETMKNEVDAHYTGPLEVQRKTVQVEIRSASREIVETERLYGHIILQLIQHAEHPTSTTQEAAVLRHQKEVLGARLCELRIRFTEHISQSSRIHADIDSSWIDKASLVADLQPSATSNSLFED